MDQPLPAHTFDEARYYLMVTACGACGAGPWQIDSTDRLQSPETPVAVQAHCRRCGAKRTFRFLCQSDTQRTPHEAELINPTAQPSRIVDLAQWMSLFYMLVESTASEQDKAATRRTGYSAALCLAEALKFYGDDELPQERAFFTEKTLAAFREHPEKFARQKLRDMQAKLPALSQIAGRVARDERSIGKRWWQFWKGHHLNPPGS